MTRRVCLAISFLVHGAVVFFILLGGGSTPGPSPDAKRSGPVSGADKRAALKTAIIDGKDAARAKGVQPEPEDLSPSGKPKTAELAHQAIAVAAPEITPPKVEKQARAEESATRPPAKASVADRGPLPEPALAAGKPPAKAEQPRTQPDTEDAPEEAMPAVDSRNVGKPSDCPPKTGDSAPDLLKPIIRIRDNVRCFADISGLRPENVAACIGDEAILVTANSLFLLTPSASERVSAPPPGRLCIRLPRDRWPAWVTSQLEKACVTGHADVRVLFSPAARSEISHTVLSALQKDEDFESASYEVTIRFEPNASPHCFELVDVKRRPLAQTRGE